MPAWWKGKSKSSSKSKSRPSDDDEGGSQTAAAYGKKEKASSFDGILAAGSNRRDAFAFGCGHPLPRPSASSSPLPSVTHDSGDGTGSASTSTSSTSSSGSSDDAPDLGFYRYSDTIKMPRGRTMVPDSRRQHHAAEYRRSPVLEYGRCSDVSVSPRKEFWLYSSDPSSNGTSHRASSRGQPFSSGPVQQRAFWMCPGSPTERQDDMRNSPHPLPLPPSSPTSSSSRPLQSRWRKGKLLGQGTFGHVYLGFSSDIGQMCAIKEVKVISDDLNSKESLKQLNQEIALLSQLVHPNIVQYYGSELDGETLSVYLEYVSGGSIHKLLQEYGPFREPVIRSYAAQILSGLAYLHGRNTMHRDIKGANILVDPSGEIKLADFGMAKHVASCTSIHSFKGSPYWMAPEVIMNGSGYNLSVDIWSLGCTILEMATSKPPWSQFEGVAAIFKIGNSKDIPDIPDHISPEGKNFLKLCLQRDPSARPTAAQLMDHPFVRDQSTIKAAKANMIRDVLPSFSDGSLTPISMEFSSNRSVSPLRDTDCGTQQIGGFPLASLNPSDLSGMRMNISLPVSPCSSPLRQYRQATRSCLPSPPNPAFLAGAINFTPSNYTLNPTRPSSNFQDTWPNVSHMRVSSPYDSPRR